jgi:hypothetical protein
MIRRASWQKMHVVLQVAAAVLSNCCMPCHCRLPAARLPSTESNVNRQASLSTCATSTTLEVAQVSPHASSIVGAPCTRCLNCTVRTATDQENGRQDRHAAKGPASIQKTASIIKTSKATCSQGAALSLAHCSNLYGVGFDIWCHQHSSHHVLRT